MLEDMIKDTESIHKGKIALKHHFHDVFTVSSTIKLEIGKCKDTDFRNDITEFKR